MPLLACASAVSLSVRPPENHGRHRHRGMVPKPERKAAAGAYVSGSGVTAIGRVRLGSGSDPLTQIEAPANIGRSSFAGLGPASREGGQHGIH